MEVPPLKCGCCWEGMSCCETHTTVVTGIYSPLLLSTSSWERSPLPYPVPQRPPLPGRKPSTLQCCPGERGQLLLCIQTHLSPTDGALKPSFRQAGLPPILFCGCLPSFALSRPFLPPSWSGYGTGSPKPLDPQSLLRTCFSYFQVCRWTGVSLDVMCRGTSVQL